MRFRTLALALALAFGMSAMAQASPKRAVIHKTARKGKVRKGTSKMAKAHKAKRGKTIKHKNV
ncbi:MAG TPA: hypothetical protein VKU19_42175 [Bryobacteraceae bacterium]|nr:hypothetical protein [Bryobacteraceae bacterium]